MVFCLMMVVCLEDEGLLDDWAVKIVEGSGQPGGLVDVKPQPCNW